MSDLVQIRLVTTAEDAASERAAAGTDGYRVTGATAVALSSDGTPVDSSLTDSLPLPGLAEARFVDPVTMTITLSVATLAVRLVNHWMKTREAGVQVDLRTKPATVSRLAGVPLGTLAIIHPDGKTTVRREVYRAPENVIGTLSKLFPQP